MLGTRALKSSAMLTGVSIKSNGLTQRFADCNVLNCSQACVLVYGTADCNSLGPDFNLTNTLLWDTVIIEDTAAVIRPLLTQDSFPFAAQSLAYVTPDEGAAGCPYIQFSFFNAKSQNAGWTYIRPGQTNSPCVSFFNGTITGYSGVTMLTEVPDNLLEWANTDGNVEEE
jgi:hypothetical protein